jgi:catechol 2,3-dioxygenase-like lactoylglutathione lyase family enzyme
MKSLAVTIVFALSAQAQPPARPRIVGIAHVAFRVSDLEKSRAYYEDFLGFAELPAKNPDGAVFVKINDQQYVELIPGLAHGADRFDHLAFETDDAERLRAYLASRDVRVPDSASKGPAGDFEFRATDPDGHAIEFVQYARDGWSARERGNFMPAARVSHSLSHAGILVGNLDDALEFYRDVLGFRETWRGSKDEKTLSWVNLRVPDGADYIEFMLYKDLPAPTERGSEHHICLQVPDIESALAKLDGRPYRKSYGRKLEYRVGINRRRQLNVFDPDGTRTELMEPVTVDGEPPVPSLAPPPR